MSADHEALLKKFLRVEMPDGSKWDVPISVIALNRAENYADEFGDDVERSLREDTVPLFCADSYEISDWAANNMDWDDVSEHAKKVDLPAPAVDYQDGWVNGRKEVVG